MSSTNTIPSSSPPSQETKTKTSLKQKNPFKKILSKAKKIFSKAKMIFPRAKSLKQEINQVEEDIDLEALWWKELTGEITEFGQTRVNQMAIKKTQGAKTPVDQKAVKKTQEAKTPVEQEAMKKSPEAKTPIEQEAIKKTQEAKTPLEQETIKESPEAKTPVEQEAIKKTLEAKTPLEQETIKESLEAKTPVEQEAIKKTLEARTPVEQEAIKKSPEAKTRKQELQEEEKVDFEGVQGEVSAAQETPSGETQAKGEDKVEGLFLQMRQSEMEGKRCDPLSRVSRESDEQSIRMSLGEERADEGSCEQVQQTMFSSGFDFQHLLVLQDFPLSSFYGVDFNNLNLPLKPSSHVQSLYGLDAESLAAENAALDEFYAKMKCEKVACEDDQYSGNQVSEDQSRNLLFPELASEEDDDLRTLKYLFGYKLYFGSLPYVLDQPATKLGPKHLLLAYVSSKLQKGGCISESRLTEKVLKLQTKYKKLVAEKGKTPERRDFSTPGGDYWFFRLSRMTWERDQESDVCQEVDVHSKDTV